MKNIFKAFAIAAAVLSVSACTMDLFPNTSIVLDPSQPLIQTEDDVNMYRMGNYAYFRNTVGVGDIADDLMCDGFNAARRYGNNYGDIHRADRTFTSSAESVESFWGNAYNAIRNYNINIDEAAKVTAESPLYEGCQWIIAEGRFFRAYTYLRLARRFGAAYDETTAEDELCVPLVLHYDQNARPARNTVKQVYDAILEDLAACEAILTENPILETDKAYLNEDALNAMYAMYYLDLCDYAQAFAYASSVCDENALCASKAELISEYTDDAGKEAIMMLPANLSANEGPAISYSIYTDYNKDAASPTGSSYGALYLPSKVLLDSYDATDYRYSAWFDDCKSIPYASEGSFYNQKCYIFTKYIGNLKLSNTEYPTGEVASVPFKMGHMFLIAAEAAAQNHDSANTLKYLNKLRAKRNAKAATAPSLEEVQKEWFRETVGDGCRMECLKRWGLGCPVRTAQPSAVAENLVMTGAAYNERALASTDYHFTWPIPSYEMKVNPNLKQNAGYSAE